MNRYWTLAVVVGLILGCGESIPQPPPVQPGPVAVTPEERLEPHQNGPGQDTSDDNGADNSRHVAPDAEPDSPVPPQVANKDPKLDAAPELESNYRKMLEDGYGDDFPKFLAALKSENPRARQLAAAAVCISADEDEGQQAVPGLIALLDDPYAEVRASAAQSLRYFIERDQVRDAPQMDLEPLVALLTKRAQDSNVEVRLEAIRGLQAIGKAADPAVPVLLTILRQDPDDVNREYAADALGAIGTQGELVIPALTKAFSNDVEHAASALGSYGPAAKSAAPEILKFIKEKYSFGDAPFVALAEIGAVESLAELLEDERERNRGQAGKALCHVRPTNAKILAHVKTALSDEKKEVRERTAEGLRHLDPEVEEGLDLVLPLLGNESDDIRSAAARALENYELDPTRKVRALLPLLARSDGFAEIYATNTIREMEDVALDPLFAAAEDEQLSLPIRAYAMSIARQFDTNILRERYHSKLTQFLDSEDTPVGVRFYAAQILSNLRERNSRINDALLRALTDGEVDSIKVDAAAALEYRKAPAAAAALREALESSNSDLQRTAATTLGNYGEDAAPALPLLETFALDAEHGAQYSSIVALGRLHAQRSIPVLLKVLQSGTDLTSQGQAVKALAQMDPRPKELAETIAQLLDDPKKKLIHDDAAEALKEMGKDALPALPALIKLATSTEDSSTRWDVVQAIGAIGPDAKSAVPALMEVIQGEDGLGTTYAIGALGKIGPDAAPAVPLLIPCLERSSTAYHAAVALTAIGPAAAPAAETLGKVVLENTRYRSAVIKALVAIGEEAKPTVPALLKVMQEAEDSDDVTAACKAVMAIDPENSELQQALLAAVEDKSRAGGLREIFAENPKRAVPFLTAALESESPEVRVHAISALNDIEDLSAARPLLEKALDDQSPQVQQAAVVLLLRDPRDLDTSKIGPLLIKALADDDQRWTVQEQLRNMGRKILPELVKSALDENNDAELRIRTLEVLQGLGDRALPAADNLQAGLKSPQPLVRCRVAATLASIAPDRETQLPVILEGLASDEAEVRQTCMNALGHYVDLPPEAIEMLLKAGHDEDEQVRSSAANALESTKLSLEVVRRLAELTKKDETRGFALSALAGYQTDVEPALPELIECLRQATDEIQYPLSSALNRVGTPAFEQVTAVLADEKASLTGRLIAARVLGQGRRSQEEELPDSSIAALTAALKSSNTELQLAAASALARAKKSGEQVVAVALATLNDKNQRRHQYQAIEALRALGKDAKSAVPAMLEILKSDNANGKEQVMRLAAECAPGDQAVIDAICAVLEDEENEETEYLRGAASFALARMGKDGLPQVLELLKSGTPPTQAAAAEALGRFDEDVSDQAVPALQQALASDDKSVATRAAISLARRFGQADGTLSLLTEALKSSNDDLVEEAAQGLSSLGEKATDAVPQLVEMLADEEKWTTALYALNSIGPPNAESLPLLLSLLSKERWSRGTVYEVLGKMDPATEGLVSALEDGLNSDDTRRVCAAALGKFGEPAQPLVATLTEQLADPQARYDAAETLGWMNEAAAPAIPKIAAMLDDENFAAQTIALTALSNLGATAAPAVEKITTKVEDPRLQGRALTALQRIGEPAAAAIPQVVAVLQNSSDEDVRRHAMVTLSYIGKGDPQATEVLLPLLDQPDSKASAIRALSRLQAAGDQVIPLLIEMLDDEKTQYDAATNLKHYGPEAKAAIPKLTELAKSSKRGMARVSQSALDAIEGRSPAEAGNNN